MEAVLVALITTLGAITVALIQAMRKENRRDHNTVSNKLDDLVHGHRRIETKIDTHINDHARGDV